MVSDEMRKKFKTNLKKIMALKGKNQSDIVKALNFKQSTVSDWLNGKKYPRMDKVQMLANYLNVDIIELVDNQSNDSITFTNTEKALIKNYRQLNEQNQQAVTTMINSLLAVENSTFEKDAVG
ncbi:helix-turn-helix domain-containing protein [Phascolarctobacterium faecium]|jgi:transcriptional regulator with XRE-family HTH domain|uniref:Helix-turn-helix domain-containing protein n=1 Tax=Phascolarctobacterium faecium TaxID=33025 RepID=A0A7X2XHP2_9FIRM|nr:helix-turn-helix transcriptional regulator [Phascolarctobacterium faecium]KAA3379433.1 helix-turn-helix transcriptional regulator [Akkermansia muciniphila]KAA4089136.1 helix-turn-helix transcriptional regulator [Bacteroides ovatus]MTS25390.1 helix-turn-helix domain-containing protein [Sellimonas intestinalis]KAA4434687.1 helix-turn-helix transcriptional regulator [Bacteroides ovatus]MTS81937.1 helix-turn-helix domain-containing protein [Phascolarctobacterium faecium]